MSDRASHATPVLAVIAAACLFGLTGTIADLGPDDLPPVAAGVWRSIIGGIGLVVVAWLAGSAPWRYSLRSWWLVAGGLGVAGYQLAFFEAVDRTGVALGTLITIGVGPPVAGALDAVVQHRPPPRRWYLGSSIAVAGVTVLSVGSVDVDGVGVVLAVAAGSSFPVFGVAAQRLMLDRPFLPAMATVFAAGAILLAPVAVITATEAFASAGSTATVAALGVLTLSVAYWLWGLGLNELSLSVVVTVTLVEPGVAALLAVAVLDESPTVALLAGLILVAVGVWVSARPARPSRPVGAPGDGESISAAC